jgi:hypothetical protein
MGTLTNLNTGGFSPMLATDDEVAAAIAAHVSKSLVGHPQNLSALDANNWNPAQNNSINNAHKSSINVIYVSSFNENTYAAIPLTNFPQGTMHGYLIQVEPEIETPYGARTQFFLNATDLYAVPQQIFWRSWNGTWSDWIGIALVSGVNTFSATQNFSTGVRVGGGGTLLKRLISQEFTIDPVAVPGQSVTGINLAVTGAKVGDVCYVSPIGPDLWNTGIWPFEWPATVSAANDVSLLLRNDWSGALDLGPLKIRVVVMGF